MKILFLCGVFAKENEAEVIAQAKKSVEFSANEMQLKLIGGLSRIAELTVLSAPFIGHFPNQGKTLYFRGFAEPQQLCRYVSFHNFWGYRNFSRARALKRAVRAFAKEKAGQKLIVVYSAHDPFLAAAAYAKRIDPSIKICFIVPDLPQYMNLESNRGFLYDFMKRFDIQSIQRHAKVVDSSIVLTREMAAAMHLDDRPYAVAEGIVDSAEARRPVRRSDTVDIVYAGKLYERFGIHDLLEAFSSISGEQYRLILCGNGDAVEQIKACAKKDARICYAGQVSPREVQTYLAEAAVLVNPRPNNEGYTKYSFPSKNIEYLMSGKPVVGFLLDGMPDCYREFLFCAPADREPSEALRVALEQALSAEERETARKYERFLEYAETHLLASAIAEKIISLNFNRGKQ